MKLFLKRLFCWPHEWYRESSLVVMRVERDTFNEELSFKVDHIRYYCPACGKIKKQPIPGQ